MHLAGVPLVEPGRAATAAMSRGRRPGPPPANGSRRCPRPDRGRSGVGEDPHEPARPQDRTAPAAAAHRASGPYRPPVGVDLVGVALGRRTTWVRCGVPSSTSPISSGASARSGRTTCTASTPRVAADQPDGWVPREAGRAADPGRQDGSQQHLVVGRVTTNPPVAVEAGTRLAQVSTAARADQPESAMTGDREQRSSAGVAACGRRRPPRTGGAACDRSGTRHRCVPASGGGLTVHMVPDVFRVLRDVLPVPAAIDAARSTVHRGLRRDLHVIALRGAAGLLLALLVDRGSGRFGHAARVATGIVRCRFDRRRGERLGGVGQQCCRIVWRRLVRVDLRVGLGQRGDHAVSQPARPTQRQCVSSGREEPRALANAPHGSAGPVRDCPGRRGAG